MFFGATKKGCKPMTKASFTVSVSEVFITHSSEMSSHEAELYWTLHISAIRYSSHEHTGGDFMRSSHTWQKSQIQKKNDKSACFCLSVCHRTDFSVLSQHTDVNRDGHLIHDMTCRIHCQFSTGCCVLNLHRTALTKFPCKHRPNSNS